MCTPVYRHNTEIVCAFVSASKVTIKTALRNKSHLTIKLFRAGCFDTLLCQFAHWRFLRALVEWSTTSTWSPGNFSYQMSCHNNRGVWCFSSDPELGLFYLLNLYLYRWCHWATRYQSQERPWDLVLDEKIVSCIIIFSSIG